MPWDWHGGLAVSLWMALVLSLAMSVYGVARGLWWWTAAAAGPSLVFSVADVFSIGWITVLLTFMQLAAAAAVAIRARGWGWAALLSGAVVIWWILVLAVW